MSVAGQRDSALSQTGPQGQLTAPWYGFHIPHLTPIASGVSRYTWLEASMGWGCSDGDKCYGRGISALSVLIVRDAHPARGKWIGQCQEGLPTDCLTSRENSRRPPANKSEAIPKRSIHIFLGSKCLKKNTILILIPVINSQHPKRSAKQDNP